MRLLPVAIAVALATLAALPAAASPVPADEMSLMNGADSFMRLCTECHGWDPFQQYDSLYDEDPVGGPDSLLDIEPEYMDSAVVDDLPPPEEEDNWPEWAGPPPEVEDAEEVALRAGMLTDLTDAIDEVYADDSSDYDWGYDTEEEQQPVLPEDVQDLDALFGKELDARMQRASGATDLTRPQSFVFGTSEDELYNIIAHGAGADMPGFLEQLGSEDAVWDLVNYIRSLWSEDWVD